ncbi:hypothetical protein GCM10027429_01880 [Marivirga atlantica]|jgi:hypothetical protein|uniref:Bacteriocin n=1 Tax=Marivirga atlantica TaxID=1548457 RepID=A0A937A7V6_9BACT|nr:hypothetical protein [Marivirga atlantica]MBL0763800.1 hypothetical protein [Marivirga atlantica]
MKNLHVNQMNTIKGGVTRAEYCGTLWTILTGGGYQGDILWGWEVFGANCAGRL